MNNIKRNQKGITSIAIIIIIIIIIIVILAIIGGTIFFINYNKKSKTQNNSVLENVKEVEKTSDNDEISKNAYDFKKDSENKNIYNVTHIKNTDLYEVILIENNNNYVIDSKGKTLFNDLGSIYTDRQNKYIYTYSDNEIRIFDLKSHTEITPKDINDNFSSKEFFVEGDIIFTYSASYDLTTGKCLWKGEKLPQCSILYKANGLMICYTADKKYFVYNYLTGKNLCDGIKDEFTTCQFNSAGYFITQVNSIAKVYDSNGKYVSQFNIPNKHKPFIYVMPGKYFCFYEDKTSPEQTTITDMTGKIIREDVYISQWTNTFSYYPESDLIMVKGDLTNRNVDWYSGLLDSSMNWVISQTDRLYKYIAIEYGDIYMVEDTDNKSYLYNIKTGAKLEYKGDVPIFEYKLKNNKLVRLGNKFYNLDNFKLVNIDYKDNYKYYQLSTDKFLGYDSIKSQNIEIYDYTGKHIKSIKLEDGSEYKAATSDSIIVYNKEKGYSILEIE